MAPKAKRTAAEAARKSERIPEVKMSKHLLTSNGRMYPTKDGKFTRTQVETKAFDDVASYFSAETAESRNRPTVGLSTCAGTLTLLRKDLTDLRGSKILGPGMDYVIRELEALQPALDILNTFGPNTARDEETMHAALTEVTVVCACFLCVACKQSVTLTLSGHPVVPEDDGEAALQDFHRHRVAGGRSLAAPWLSACRVGLSFHESGGVCAKYWTTQGLFLASVVCVWWHVFSGDARFPGSAMPRRAGRVASGGAPEEEPQVDDDVPEQRNACKERGHEKELLGVIHHSGGLFHAWRRGGGRRMRAPLARHSVGFSGRPSKASHLPVVRGVSTQCALGKPRACHK